MHHSDKAPAFLVSEAGYDVWLINSRGSGPSRQHVTLDPDFAVNQEEGSFWNFDW